MVEDREARLWLKKILQYCTFFLSGVLVLLVTYVIMVVRPSHFQQAILAAQYYYYDIEALPTTTNSIDATYHPKTATKPQEHRQELSDKLLRSEAPKSEVLSTPAAQHEIAIIITHLGINKRATELALSLQPEVALGFLPYTTNLKPLLINGQQAGHEIFMYLPFETANYPHDDPGHLPILQALDWHTNSLRIEQLLHSYQDFAGIYSTPQETFLNNEEQAAKFLASLRAKKLKLIMGRAVPEKLVSDADNNVAAANIFIDASPNVEAIKDQLDKLVMLAKEGKPAIGYAGSYPVTIYTLKAWITSLQEHGIKLVPLSQMIQKVKNAPPPR